MWGIEFFAFLALGFALFADDLEFAFAAIDAEVGETSVDLDLFFTHAAFGTAAATGSGTTATAFAVKVSPHAGETGEGVLHFREFDLQACLLGLGSFPENIENHFFAVDDAEIGEFFPLTLLGRGEVVINDDAVAFVGFGERDHFRGFAGSAEKLFVHFAGFREDGFGDLDAEGGHEFTEFF